MEGLDRDATAPAPSPQPPAPCRADASSAAPIEARHRYAERLAHQEEVLGAEHWDTLVTRTHLAAELLRAGEHAVGLAVLAGVLRAGRRIAGPPGP